MLSLTLYVRWKVRQNVKLFIEEPYSCDFYRLYNYTLCIFCSTSWRSLWSELGRKSEKWGEEDDVQNSQKRNEINVESSC